MTLPCKQPYTPPHIHKIRMTHHRDCDATHTLGGAWPHNPHHQQRWANSAYYTHMHLMRTEEVEGGRDRGVWETLKTVHPWREGDIWRMTWGTTQVNKTNEFVHAMFQAYMHLTYPHAADLWKGYFGKTIIQKCSLQRQSLKGMRAT